MMSIKSLATATQWLEQQWLEQQRMVAPSFAIKSLSRRVIVCSNEIVVLKLIHKINFHNIICSINSIELCSSKSFGFIVFFVDISENL